MNKVSKKLNYETNNSVFKRHTGSMIDGAYSGCALASSSV